MNSDFMFDIDGMIKSIDSADVVSIFFPSFRKALVVDPRSNERHSAMVQIAPMASSPQERLRLIRRQRSGLPRVRNLAVIPWTRYVDSLIRLGLWDKLIERLESEGEDEAVEECERALTELRQMEREELVNAIAGRNYHTIWSAERD